METINTKMYVIGGKVDGKQMYISEDTGSGYTYRTEMLPNNFFETTSEIVGGFKSANEDYARIEKPILYEIVLKEVDATIYKKNIQKITDFINSLTDEEREYVSELLS